MLFLCISFIVIAPAFKICMCVVTGGSWRSLTDLLVCLVKRCISLNVTDLAAAPISPFAAGVFLAGASGGCCCCFSVPEHGGKKQSNVILREVQCASMGSSGSPASMACANSHGPQPRKSTKSLTVVDSEHHLVWKTGCVSYSVTGRGGRAGREQLPLRSLQQGAAKSSVVEVSCLSHFQCVRLDTLAGKRFSSVTGLARSC